MIGSRVGSFRALALSSCAALALSIGVVESANADAPRNTTGQTVQFQIPVQSLASALSQFARQSGRQLLFSPDIVAGKTANAVVGAIEPLAAFDRLIAGSGLTYSLTGSGAILLRDPAHPSAAAAAEPEKPRQTDADSRTNEDTSAQSDPVEKVVVTGSRIKGARPTSPVVTITQDEMRRSGQNNLGEVVRSLPQNFNGGQNPEVALGASAGGGSNTNIGGGSSLNLRGLGADATLVLLNGTRLPYDGTTQATDVSVIPVAAIQRVEVVLDGASAIYGSDAVGGVANIILKRDYEGVELSARYGGATDGGYEQTQFTGVAGHTWSTGGFLITGDVSRNSSVNAGERDYLSYMPDSANVTTYPQLTQKGTLFSGHQELGAYAELMVDAFYTERQQVSRIQDFSTIFVAEPKTTIWGIAPSIRFTLSPDWSLRLHAFAGRNETEAHDTRFAVATGAKTGDLRSCYCNEVEALGVEAEGLLFALPAGDVRLSVGGGYRRNEFHNNNLITGATELGGADQSNYVYAEANIPLVSEAQGIPLMTRLMLNGAIRHENYDSFGETTTPKVGAIWGLAPGFDIKASWGKSFKVPTLVQQYQTTTLFLYPSFIFPTAAAGTAVMAEFGGNPDLEPERAETVTAGFVAQPDFLSGFKFEFSWFNVDFTDRVVTPITPFTQGFVNPVFAEFTQLSPTVAQQNAAFAAAGLPVGTFTGNFAGPGFTPGVYDPANVYGILDNRYANAASQHVRGIDLTAYYATDLFGGSLTASANASWIESQRRLTALAPEQQTSGFVFYPAEFRGRFGASWAQDGLTLSSYVNHIAGVIDTNVAPTVERDDMTTVDLVVDYQTDDGPLGGFGVTLAVVNVFDEPPPFMQPLFNYHVSYDSTNYSAVGRTVSVTVTQRF